MKSYKKLILYLIIGIGAIFFESNSCEALHIDSLILADLKGVLIRIDFSDDISNKYKIDSKKIKGRYEDQLKNAHIRVYKEETTEYYLTGSPTILINIKPSYCRISDSFSFVYETSFRLTLRTSTNPKATIWAVIALTRTIQCDGNLPDIMSIADDHIDDFIGAFCKFKNSSFCKN